MFAPRLKFQVSKNFDKLSNIKKYRVIVLDSNMKYPMTRSEQEYLELHHEAQFMHHEFWKQQNENYKKLASDDKLNPARLAKLKTYHTTWREYNRDLIKLQYRCFFERFLPFLRKFE